METVDPLGSLQLGSPHDIKPWAGIHGASPYDQLACASDFSPPATSDGLSSQLATPSTPWKPPMVSYNSCPNLTSAFGATCLESGTSHASRCATPQQSTSTGNGLAPVMPGTDSTPTVSSLPSAPQQASTAGAGMNRSQSAGQLLDQQSPPDTASSVPGCRSDQPGVSSVAPRALYMSPAKAAAAHAQTPSDAKVAFRQTALTRSMSEYSTTTESTSSGTPYELMSSQSSFSPNSGIDRSTSSASLASSFGSYLTGDEGSASRSSPPSSESLPSPGGTAPALISLMRRNGANNAAGRTTRSKANTTVAVGKPRRSSKLTELDRKRICEYHRDHPSANQDAIGLRFGVERSTVSKTLKDKEKWLAIDEDPEATIMSRSASNRRTGTNSNSATSRPPSPVLPSPVSSSSKPLLSSNRACRFPEVETQVVDWARATASQGEFLTDAMLKERARLVATSMNISEQQFKASQGWLERFKVRSGISGGRFLEDDRGHLMPTPLDTSRPYIETGYPLPSPQEPLSSSSSSTGSFFDDHDQDPARPGQNARMRSDSTASGTLSVSTSGAYGSVIDPTSAMALDQLHLPASQPLHPSIPQHYPHTPITPHDMTHASAPQPLTFNTHMNESQQNQQAYQYHHPESYFPGQSAPPFMQGSAFGAPQPADARPQPPPLARRATVSVPDARSVQHQSQYMSFGSRQSNDNYPPIELHQAQSALGVLTQFLQQQQHRLVSPLAMQTISDLHNLLLSSPDSSAAYRPAEEFEMHSGQHSGNISPAFSTGERKVGFNEAFSAGGHQPMHQYPHSTMEAGPRLSYQ